MRTRLGILFLVAAVSLVGLARHSQGKPAGKKPLGNKPQPCVEVVFCLDTTGSMGGLIQGAKQKIWSLCNQIAGGKPTPKLKVGLVAYRDHGDDYVTKVIDLTDDLDAIHGKLMAFQASGGGDEPESVNEALHAAVRKMSWNRDKGVLRIVYLVGDAPPHMDYPNDVTYKVTCREACEQDIIINTIQCGALQGTTPIWQEIAQKAEGRFVQIAQDGGVQIVNTPFDARLAEINGAMAKTAIPYGSVETRAEAVAMTSACATTAPVMSAPTSGICLGMPTTFASGAAPTTFASCAPPALAPCCSAVAADRAGWCAKTGKVAALDLVDSIKQGKTKLEELKSEELPEEMQKLDLPARRDYLTRVERERSRLQAEALELDRKRSEFISQEQRRTGRAGFDEQVMDMLREQAKKHDIAY